MKKIIFTVTNDLTYDQRMQRICSSLAGNGFHVTLIGRKRGNSIPVDNSRAYQQIRFRCVFNKGKLFYAEFNLRLLVFLLLYSFDLACAIDLDTIPAVQIACKLKNRKMIYDAHEFFTEMPELEEHHLVKKIWEAVGRYCIRSSDLCYTVSSSLAGVLEKKYHKPFHTILNAPPLKPTVNYPQKIQGQIIYQGAINKGRGLEELILAVKTLDVKVVIAGQGDIEKKIRNMIENENVSHKVRMTGPLKPSELVQFTMESWLGYNMLSTTNLSYFYSLSNKFFDYIHAGLPVITNNFPEYRKINEIFEVAVCPDINVDSIKNSILSLILDEKFYLRLQENCLKAKEIFNWQNEEKKLLELYRGI